METTAEKKLELIAQLLAKAESTTPEEAEALTEHASRLMVKYGIEQARIDERRAKLGQASERIIEERMIFRGTYARDLRGIGIDVVFGLGTMRPLQSEWRGEGSVLHIVGFESDVQQAKTLIASLELQAMVALRAWWKQVRASYAYEWYTESDRRRARSGFLRGFGSGAGARIRESRQRVVEEAGTGTDLVLVSRRKRVDAEVDSQTRGVARGRRQADSHGFSYGHRAGRQANTGERQVTSGRALTA